MQQGFFPLFLVKLHWHWHRWNSNATVPNWRLIAHKLNMMIFRRGSIHVSVADDEFINILSTSFILR